MDGGNSDFHDSNRRIRELREHGIRFLGVGVSGGEKGALNSPALMPGGDLEAYRLVAPILEKIAAHVDGKPCCTYIGPAGSGHYVKMVHNGIEYADMQLISEAYQFLTANILSKTDQETGKPMMEVILDKAGQKGTGKWSSQEALDLGVPSTIITEAVYARYLSSMKSERICAEKLLAGSSPAKEKMDKEYWVNLMKEALYMGKLCTYAQGFYQYQGASAKYGWSLDLGEIALIFRGGCIIRADFLNKIYRAFKENRDLANLLLAPCFLEKTNRYQASLRKVVMKGMESGLSLPCFSSALSFCDGCRSSRTGVNLIQAQRDYFGAHKYERIDQEGTFHTNWLEPGAIKSSLKTDI